ncbi:hypothetical protein BegalDRAFT_0135 [Beggiatoa alba B18LD]|uniref:DUF4279 domain-containing protein n=1 Tax=Beggiatoa alba B18LD TaxID=395493 RepID=I3CBR6_9GAMM|nr:DUF4279 domain-containing protein [Beggiatoa alba]EIJ41059.1 hypothetical protein BegalDRAFT_0135 [Beggiatoa alba B18LD]
MDDDKNEIVIGLTITDFNELPSEITKILGVQPSKTWCKGDLISKSGIIRHKQNGWKLCSSLSKSQSFKEHEKDLLDKILLFKDKFKNLPSECNVEFSCYVDIYNEDIPELSLEKDTVKVLSEINASVDIDIYFLYEPEAE